MKIEIQNLGPIHHFEFDLEKDLHLLYGENNVGKSFAVNILYCLLKPICKPKSFEISEYAIKETDKNYSFDQILLSRVKVFWEKNIVGEFNEALKNTYDRLLLKKDSHKKKSLLRIICTGYYVVEFKISDDQHLEIDRIIIDQNFLKNVQNKEIKDNLTNFKIIMDFTSGPLGFFSNLYLLPAGKSGLYAPLNGMGEIIAQLSQYRLSLKAKIDLPALSQPISDYYLNLVNIEKNITEKDVSDFAKMIEDRILKGRISMDSKTNRIYYLPKNLNEKIHVTQTASMISELAPLVLYLRYVVPKSNGNVVLILEEPEAHLHPKVQIQLMEIFAELTKHNVKVILTSHSNYMFNKLSNMLLAKEIAPEKVAVYHMEMTDKGSIVNPDMQATTEGIEDHNFADVAQKLYQERLETYQVLNEEGDAYQ